MQQKVALVSLITIIALGVIGYSFYQWFVDQEVVEPIEVDEEEQILPEEISYPAITPTEVADGFYNWYVEEGNALPSDKYLEAESLSDSFENRITAGLTMGNLEQDPLLCVAEIPESPTIVIRDTEIMEDRATAIVDVDFVEEGVSFMIEFILTENAWKIDNVLCFVKS